MKSKDKVKKEKKVNNFKSLEELKEKKVYKSGKEVAEIYIIEDKKGDKNER